MSVKAKKHLGQHFLTDESIAQKIADSISLENYSKVLEIGLVWVYLQNIYWRSQLKLL
jgi:16S rRNA A1518/A1519 N6-dimethyltransferase RsmA/KsgA/DIM1 with predicted DNA glycosylase/AP lyase activity